MKKISMSPDYLTAIAKMPNLTTYHYKLLLLLAVEPKTQTQAAEVLGIKRQNANKYITDLQKYGLIEVDRVEGRNKYLKAVTTATVPTAVQQAIDLNQLYLY